MKPPLLKQDVKALLDSRPTKAVIAAGTRPFVGTKMVFISQSQARTQVPCIGELGSLHYPRYSHCSYTDVGPPHRVRKSESALLPSL